MIVVIGGGLAGLRAALTIQGSGQQVHLIESEERVGGRMSSSIIDGFTIDRGFQVINPGYSEMVALDIATNFHSISAGAVAQIGGYSTFYGDPRRELRNTAVALPRVLRNINPFIALLRGIFIAKIDKNESAEHFLKRMGVSGEIYENLMEPFLRGVFLTSLANVDARFARRVLRSLYRQVPGLPDGGVQALAQELRNRVKSIQCGERVRQITRSGKGFSILTDNSTFTARKVVVATEYQSALSFNSNLPQVRFARSTAWYFTVENVLSKSHQLHVSSRADGPIVTSIELSSIVPSYSPDGRGLLSVTTLESVPESEVRAHIAALYGENLEGDLIARIEIENALPIFTPGERRTGVIDDDGMIFAGDYLTEPSQNGALLSGRLAGERAINN